MITSYKYCLECGEFREVHPRVNKCPVCKIKESLRTCKCDLNFRRALQLKRIIDKKASEIIQKVRQSDEIDETSLINMVRNELETVMETGMGFQRQPKKIEKGRVIRYLRAMGGMEKHGPPDCLFSKHISPY